MLLILSMTGCSFGPQALKGNRLDYNISIQTSNNEELVLNIVRARYVEPLFFLQVGSVSSSFGFSSTAGLTGSIYEKVQTPTPAVLTPSISGSFSENPTITYSPLQGEKMVRQLQSEMPLDRFLTLVRTGFGIEGLMWLAVVKMGDLGNYGVHGRDDTGSYEKVLELARKLGSIQQRGDLEFSGIKDAGTDRIVIQIRYRDAAEADDIERRLGVKPDRMVMSDGRPVSVIEMSSVRDFAACQTDGRKCSQLFIKLKSYYQMIYDMALHVDIPDDLASGTLRYRPPTGDLGSREGIHTGLIRIKSAAGRPGSAFVAVPYRGLWFYIDDSDIETKRGFMLLSSVFSLQSGDLPPMAPVLTLPVGR
jgi:hypothetical protein